MPKFFRISLLLNYMMDLVPIWYKDRYCSPPPPPPLPPTTHTHTGYVKIKVTEFSRNKMCNIRRAILSGDRSCLKGTPKVMYPNKKCIDYIEEWPFNVIFLYNLYIFICLKVDPKKCCIQTKCIDYVEKMTIHGQFFCIIYTFLFV